MCIWITYGIPNVSQSEEEGMRQSDSFNNRSVLAMNMSGFCCSGCGTAIRIEGLESAISERKVYCTRCGHVTVI